MTPRSIRRAAERKAVKQARKAGKSTSQTIVAVPTPTPVQGANLTPTSIPVSAAKLAANQANAQHSTGPSSEAGKQISSQNALKTGLTGRAVLLPTDHLPAYEALLERFQSKYKPANPEERSLAQSIIDTTWRLERVANLDFAIFAKGSVEIAEQFAEEFQDLDPGSRAQMIQVETYLKYEKQLRNLHTQEARLQRLLKTETAELQRLQSERQQQEAELQAFLAKRASKNPPSQSAAPEVGFEFANAESKDFDFADLNPNFASAAPNPYAEQSL